MKKILIFSLNYYPRYIGGAEIALKELTDRMSDIEFHMVTLRFDADLPTVERVGNVLVHRIGFTKASPSIRDLGKFPLHLNKHVFQLLAAWEAHKLNRRYQYDAVWAMMAHAAGIPASIFKTFHPRVPFLLTLQEGDPSQYIERLMKPVWPLFKRAFTSADYVQAISTYLLNWSRRMGFCGDRRVIPNAVNTAHFAHVFSEAEREKERMRLHKREGEIFLVTTSRLVHKNGIESVIRSLPLLPQHVSFLIYGIGPDEEKLRALAATLGVMERTRFMGQIDHADMPLMLSACDIFIRPSRSEGMGNSFVEAFAAGLPVIATQEGGIKDFLFDAALNPNEDTTGWAVEVDAPDQIAEAVTSILSHPEKVQEVIRNAKALALEKYDWDIIAKDMRALFDDLLKTR